MKKHFRTAFPFLACALALACLVQTDHASAGRSPDWEKTYSVLPGKTLNIRNRSFHVVEIRSEYEVQIAAGPCHVDSTVQWRCEFDDPADLFIRDLRTPPLVTAPRANSITVSAWE